VVAPDLLLLDSKLSVPPPRPGFVSRAGLIEKARESGCRVIGVTAPAGYGKSTLLVEWALAEDRPVVWVSFDRLDDDPALVLSLLASAYARAWPAGAGLIADVSGAGVSVLGRAAPRLASAFRASPVPFVVMLDDLHELRSPACHDVLSVVISGIPPGSQLVAASRFEQPHLPRLRAAGDALEFMAADLALDPAGAEQIFSQADVSLTRELAAAVTERTEGWPAGLYLAAVIAGSNDGEPLTVSGEDRWVADYLYRESLVRLPESVQRFLRRTAVLDRLSAPLCEAVLAESGAQEQLRGLEASSLFLIPLDRRREWYRYHASRSPAGGRHWPASRSAAGWARRSGPGRLAVAAGAAWAAWSMRPAIWSKVSASTIGRWLAAAAVMLLHAVPSSGSDITLDLLCAPAGRRHRRDWRAGRPAAPRRRRPAAGPGGSPGGEHVDRWRRSPDGLLLRRNPRRRPGHRRLQHRAPHHRPGRLDRRASHDGPGRRAHPAGRRLPARTPAHRHRGPDRRGICPGWRRCLSEHPVPLSPDRTREGAADRGALFPLCHHTARSG
jgi:hypothetical protein